MKSLLLIYIQICLLTLIIINGVEVLSFERDTLIALVDTTSIMTSRGKRNTAVITPEMMATTNSAMNMYSLKKCSKKKLDLQYYDFCIQHFVICQTTMSFSGI